jgi:iron complex outermembrane receptor protein
MNSGTDVSTGQGLKPSIIDQYEAGIKNEFFNGKLSANLSIYRIVNNNLAVISPYKADGITINSDNTVKTFSGQTTSDGLEVDITGNLNKNFYFIAGYACNNARYTKTSGLKGSYIEEEQLVVNPKNTANASLFYTFSKSGLRGVKVGASAFYTGSRFAGYNNTIGQAQPYSRLLPVGGFATLDLSAGYSYKKISLLAQISNVTNRLNYLIHDNYSITPIAPRQFLTTMAYKF